MIDGGASASVAEDLDEDQLPEEAEASSEVTSEAEVPEAAPEEEREPSEAEKLKASYELDLEHVRMVEALLFAAAEPLDERTLADRLPVDDGDALVGELLEGREAVDGAVDGQGEGEPARRPPVPLVLEPGEERREVVGR